MSGPYDDIMDLPHPDPAGHPRMPMADRAAQFSPFAALTGHGAAVRETARLTEERMALSEEGRAELDWKLRAIADRAGEHPEVSIVYFKADGKKEGGAYMTVSGPVGKIDSRRRAVVMDGGAAIPIRDVVEITGPLFPAME